MKIIRFPSAAVLALSLAACGQPETTPENTAAPAAQPIAPEAQGQEYSATGDVTEISGDRVTISHGPVEEIGWPAMTMEFRASSPEMVQGISVGDPVTFEFRKADGEYVLTSISRAQ